VSPTYAEGTTVTPEKSRGEIERTLTRYGADAFSYGWDGDRAMLAFRASGRMIRFELPMPPLADFRYTPSGRRERDHAGMVAEREKAMRQRWRALALVVKAKLEAVEAGISEFEQEFMANIVLPDNTTVGDWMGPQIAEAYERGTMPKLLPAPST
jgi:hypothetical protein